MAINSGLERSTVAVASLTAFMSPFMISAISVALPRIQKDLSMNAVEMGWVATSYLLSMAVALIPAGKVADIRGRKKIFISGIILFTLASTLAAFASSTAWLIAMRVGQGLGAAMYNTTAMAIITSVFPPQRRGQALGIYVAAVYIGLSLGPFVGGMLVSYLGWWSIFLVPLPVGLVSLAISLRYLEGEWAEARGERLDVVGSLLYAVAVFGLIYGLTLLPILKAWGFMAVGAVAMVIFVVVQLRIRFPVFDVSLFMTNRVFAFSSLAALINYGATAAIAFLVSLYLQYIKGLPPQSAGIVMIAQPICQVLLSPLAGRLADRLQPRIIATAGMTLTAIGLGVFSRFTPETPIPAMVANLILMGIGFAFFSSPNMSAIMGAVEKRHYGIASGALATMRMLGQMLSMAIATMLLAYFIGKRAITPDNYALFMKSMSTAFSIFTVMCFVGIFFSLIRGKARQNQGQHPQ